MVTTTFTRKRSARTSPQSPPVAPAAAQAAAAQTLYTPPHRTTAPTTSSGTTVDVILVQVEVHSDAPDRPNTEGRRELTALTPSTARAGAVKGLVRREWHLRGPRITTHGLGDSYPIYPHPRKITVTGGPP